LFGFCEDYKRLIINARHELILIRVCNDYNCLIGNPVTESEELFKVQWPHVKRDQYIINAASIEKRSLCEHKFSLVGSVRVSSVTEYNKAFMGHQNDDLSRDTLSALQTGQKNIMSQDVSVFDDCNLNNVKLYLNSAFYPYDDLNLNFDKKRYAVLFDMYTRFHRAYYRINCFVTFANAKKNFIANATQRTFIYRERWTKRIKSAIVDVRIEFDSKCNSLLSHHTRSRSSV